MTNTPQKVLIVEDEMIVQMHLETIVSGLGHEVTGTAANSDEAYDSAESAHPDLVLMDIHLADGCDGVETARTLRERYDCAVVFITAYADAQTVDRTSEVVPAGYVMKPFTGNEIRAAIKTALAGHGHLQRAKEHARSLEALIGKPNHAVFVTDGQGALTFQNPQAEPLRADGAHTLGGDLTELLHFASRMDHAAFLKGIEDAKDRGNVALAEFELLDQAGREMSITAVIDPLIDRSGEITGYVLALKGAPGGAFSQASAPSVAAEPRHFGDGTRLMVYSHDTLGLGHLRRSLCLIRQLSEDHPGLSTLLVSGSPMAHRYQLPPGTDYVKLPAVHKVGSESYEARSLSMTDDGILSMRANLLLRTVRDYKPDVLLVDHSPTGMRGELLPALEWLDEHPGCTRILGLRDIIDDPQRIREQWAGNGMHDVLEKHYDHVVVYGSPDVYDTAREYGLPESIVKRTSYMNYVCAHNEPVPDDEQAPKEEDQPLVVVAIGGGDGGAETVIAPFLEMLHQYEQHGSIGFRTEILLGPFFAPGAEKTLRASAEDLPVDMKNFVPAPSRLFAAAELVISTAGYNSTSEILQHGKRAILIPRVMHRQEQLIRARRMAELGLVSCLHPDDVTPAVLLAEIQRMFALPEEPLTEARRTGRIPLDGAKRFSEFCGKLMIGRQAKPTPASQGD
jgi:predicted glycosyltransferase/DNA-binding NarL/FixJ family response regulator